MHFKYNNMEKSKLKARKKIYHVNTNQKKTGQSLVSDNLYFWARKITRDKEEYYIMITMPIHQEDIMILNVYVSNNTASKYTKQKMIEQKKGKR